MTDRFDIFYESRELAEELGDPLLDTVTTHSPEEAVRLAGRDPEIIRRTMPCAGLWAVRVKDQDLKRER